MGDKDRITNDYVRNPYVFADAFNKFLYSGRQVIKAEQLTDLDSREIVLPYGQVGKKVSSEKFRDAIRILCSMTDGKTAYVILGIENQSNIHYAMPVRNGLYDFMQYAYQVRQYENANRNHKKADAGIKESASQAAANDKDGEFLSGIRKCDKLIPVVTLTIYFGAEEWDAPLRLSDMYAAEDEEILKYAPDYKVNLLAPCNMSDEEIYEFHSGLREIMLFIKYSKDKEKFVDILNNSERFSHMDRDTVDVIRAVTGSKIEYDNREDTVNMCIAEMELMEDARAEGVTAGKIEGRKEGIAEGLNNAINRMLAADIDENTIISMGFTEDEILQAKLSVNAG